MSKVVDKVIDSVYSSLHTQKVQDDVRQYHVDNLVISAIIKGKKADEYKLDLPRED